MGLLTTTEDPQLKEARQQVVPGEVVCPACKSPFTKSGETLTALNAPLGIEAHKCPGCGSIVSARRAPTGQL
jgi:hypothetical protein